MSTIFTLKEQKEYNAWLQDKASIQRGSPATRETEDQRQKRIKKLLNDFSAFGHYYFPHLIDSDFAYFHKRDAKYIIEHSDCFAMLEWPREHAKSIIIDVILPMMLKARGELTGMMIASANQDKAQTLLSDIQGELMFNKRYIADFGEQYNQGKWTDGHFTTVDGIGFWSFGRGQSPRGTREMEKRPNYGTFDDIDDKVLVRNESRVDEVVDWLLEDFYGAMPIKGSRLIGVGNRIHRKSVVAKIVGDVEPDDPKRDGLYHSKVFALENPKNHKKDLSENGVPAWPRYSAKEIMDKMKKMGWRRGLREYFHEHIVEGKTFREEHLPWVEILPLCQYDKIISYNDPSYKNSKTSDFKAITVIGKTGRYYDIINCFVRQCSTAEMVRGHYNLAEGLPEKLEVKHWMEANFIQDLMLEEYWRVGEERGKTLRIRGDKRKKPDKEVRIENLTPLTEQGFIRFNKALKHSPDMQELRNQFFGFPDYEHDDGPDSVEGGIYLLDQKSEGGRRGKREIRQGKTNSTSRR